MADEGTTSPALAAEGSKPGNISPSHSRSIAAANQMPVRPAVAGSSVTRTVTRTRRSRRPDAARIPPEDHPLSADNLAKRGYYTFQCLGVPFHVHRRYRFVRELGIGAYGCVALCRDELLDCNVAIKKVTRIFDRDVLARRALREVAILRHLGGCDNITTLLDFDASFVEFAEVYFVLSASEADLSQIIRSGQTLSDAHLQYFMAQLLRGTRYMHAANVIHRDLKPGNILVNADCALRLCDFGLARAFAVPHDSDEHPFYRPRTPETREGSPCPPHSPARSSSGRYSPEPYSPDKPQPDRPLSLSTSRLDFPGGPLTDYVATRWYRAPEIMLCLKDGYGPEIDMWSIGCILAELISGRPIFPGKDYVDQIARINGVLGAPSEATIAKIGSERARTYLLSLPREAVTPLSQLFPDASPAVVDLLSKLLTWDPADRITAAEALQHPWLKAYHRSNAQWIPPPPFSRFANVEFIKSLPSFRAAFDLQAAEIRAENEGLEDAEQPQCGCSDGSEDSSDCREVDGPSGCCSARHGQRPAADDTMAERRVGVSSSSSSGNSNQSHLAPTSATSAGSSVATPCSSTMGDEAVLLSPGMYPRGRRSHSGSMQTDSFRSIKTQQRAAFPHFTSVQDFTARKRAASELPVKPYVDEDEAASMRAILAQVAYDSPSEWLGVEMQPGSKGGRSLQRVAGGTGRRRARSHSFSQLRIGDASAFMTAANPRLLAVTPAEGVMRPPVVAA
ncbi:hypothetical protein OC846_001056 [Tilletia horrida]|uniref:Mitogen-activated protein kinase n=1 Tax=Tilletia horrida TaxID=155126 RepID=A0AAN6GVY6_9BASI|nr:hypothetical protein OC846_001056 [Tilletia horrida]